MIFITTLLSIITSILGSSMLKRFPYKLDRIDIKDINLSFMLLNTSLSLVMYFIYENALTQVYYSILSTILLLIAFIDIKHMVIPDILTILAIIITIGYKVLYYSLYGNEFIISQVLVSILIPVILFILLMALPGDGIGEGDIVLGGLLGLILGIDKIVILLIISFGLFIIISLVMMNNQGRKLSIKFPFTPFMIITFYTIQLIL